MKKKDQVFSAGHRRQFDAEFKASAVEMVQSGRSVAEVSRALGIRENLLHKWRSAAKSTPSLEEQTEVERLRRQVKQLELERDILKKALSIFSRTI